MGMPLDLYEPFLAAFDPLLRGRLGVWYTPKEVTQYQVARVDQQIRDALGVATGLADASVYVLDPACGTGTYLASLIRYVYQTHMDNGEPQSVAATRAREAAVTRSSDSGWPPRSLSATCTWRECSRKSARPARA